MKSTVNDLDNKGIRRKNDPISEDHRKAQPMF